MKKLLSMILLSLMLASCDSIEEINKKYNLYGNWTGEIRYEIMSENDYLIKSMIFSDDSKKCTVYTGLSFLNSIDEENLIVRVSGDNQLILTEENNNRTIYTLFLTESNLDSFEMKWNNHTKIEKKHIPDKSLSMKMNRVVIYWNHF